MAFPESRPPARPAPGDDRSMTIFVYFRAAPQHRRDTAAALGRHFVAVEAACGLRGRGGLRHDRDKPYLTWLEIYEGVDARRLQAVVDAIEASASASGLAALAPEGRHREVFESLTSG